MGARPAGVRRLASGIFARIGVSIDWRVLNPCPSSGAIRVTLSYHPSYVPNPGAHCAARINYGLRGAVDRGRRLGKNQAFVRHAI